MSGNGITNSTFADESVLPGETPSSVDTIPQDTQSTDLPPPQSGGSSHRKSRKMSKSKRARKMKTNKKKKKNNKSKSRSKKNTRRKLRR